MSIICKIKIWGIIS